MQARSEISSDSNYMSQQTKNLEQQKDQLTSNYKTKQNSLKNKE